MIFTYFVVAITLFWVLRANNVPTLDAAMTACGWPVLFLLGGVVAGVMLVELITHRGHVL